MPHQKPNLPQKPCAGCGRPFAWRRKWARVWDEVRFCSQACRDGRHPAAKAAAREKSVPDAEMELRPLDRGRTTR
ncbi:DUF2256 domain-containing protein [Teichococcus aestuarii]|uniref:DUF2256 domain-containing protein n=1 Tax=Teichococcus aestuarii TaxID=568898 RepID=A0A2U1V9C9_9PROT|nr:hypothetical protein CR165_00515 [Pseudoroseomonas aestuarii]